MSTTYAWTFDLQTATSPVDGKDDVIKEIHWRFVATTDDDPPLAPNVYSSVALGDPDDSFVAFNDVTKEMCRDWVLAACGKTEDELIAMLDRQIAAIKTPALASKVPSSW
tara:strand:+ start:1446 stop:1775 length:330 start_codon:yes stop_codon:yes gene_type:complete